MDGFGGVASCPKVALDDDDDMDEIPLPACCTLRSTRVIQQYRPEISSRAIVI